VVREVRIYIEGGGHDKETKARLREGFSAFLSTLRTTARNKRINFSIILCGSRNDTFDNFQTALKTHPDAFNILLVDAEAAIKHQSPWQHLHQQDGWVKPHKVSEDQCHLMVQTMEAWIIADINALKKFYGRGFNPKAIPQNRNIEQIAKNDVESSLQEATKRTKKGQYHKTQHAPQLLERLNVAQVRQAAPYCQRLFATLEQKLDEQV
jgi:hypothetical protein